VLALWSRTVVKAVGSAPRALSPAGVVSPPDRSDLKHDRTTEPTRAHDSEPQARTATTRHT